MTTDKAFEPDELGITHANPPRGASAFHTMRLKRLEALQQKPDPEPINLTDLLLKPSRMLKP